MYTRTASRVPPVPDHRRTPNSQTNPTGALAVVWSLLCTSIDKGATFVDRLAWRSRELFSRNRSLPDQVTDIVVSKSFLVILI
ncbi:unnamed protein product [Macrosiphum euphorbiae]|uniref:Uncharacterized protein n=1 Tax=Macrosiphum euphorbiae TaxID=13131 RepID=A0AAV0XDE3_9HEMI|nr:unnamed protein product [Macrosiphum euphorbiae]